MPDTATEEFTDITNHWAKDAILYAVDKNLFNGINANTFAPDMSMTRAMLVTVLHRLEGAPASGSHSFNDVASGSWYGQAVAWAAGNNIVTGYDEQTFGPDNTITREQLAAILYRYAQFKGIETPSEGMSLREFADADSVSDWAAPAMQWAINAGIISGRDGNILDPGGNATRAEVATMLMRCLLYTSRCV